MSPLMIVLVLGLGIGAGVLSGLLGIGGGMVLIPAFVYWFGMSQQKAQGTSLAVLLLPIGLLAVRRYYQSGQVDLRIAALVALGFFGGAWLGAVFANQINETLLRRGFAVFLLAVAIQMLLEK
ncbi:MAG TPA: sulfite exporter TauE/SafE family protein [bacterium]|nr:sulfite exporter TauE/SafE family protein [bacterium]